MRLSKLTILLLIVTGCASCPEIEERALWAGAHNGNLHVMIYSEGVTDEEPEVTIEIDGERYFQGPILAGSHTTTDLSFWLPNRSVYVAISSDTHRETFWVHGHIVDQLLGERADIFEPQPKVFVTVRLWHEERKLEYIGYEMSKEALPNF